mgnify:FL=1
MYMIKLEAIHMRLLKGTEIALALLTYTAALPIVQQRIALNVAIGYDGVIKKIFCR